MPSVIHWQRLAALSIAAFVAVSLCLVSAPDASAAMTRNQKVRHAAHVATNQIGDPYRYGAAGPRAFDCSGLVTYSFAKAGIRLPRTSRAQASATRRILRRDMHVGDLMFFHRSGRVYHAAIYLGWRHGRRLMVHASRSGVPVRTDVPWTNSWFPTTVRHR